MQNVTGYFTLFVGILFVMILLNFAVGLPATLMNYQAHAAEYMITDYQYILKKTVGADGSEITTREKKAEKYSSKGLLTVDGVHVDEEITVYGYNEDSRYISLPYNLDDKEIYVSQSYADKFGLVEGQELTLRMKYSFCLVKAVWLE